jgi:hypothetical protein
MRDTGTTNHPPLSVAMYQTTKIPELIDPQATSRPMGRSLAGARNYGEFAAATACAACVPRFRCSEARIKQGHPYYAKAERISQLLSDATGGDLGRRTQIDGSGEPRRIRRQVARDRAQHPAAERTGRQCIQDVSFDFRYFFARK